MNPIHPQKRQHQLHPPSPHFFHPNTIKIILSLVYQTLIAIKKIISKQGRGVQILYFYSSSQEKSSNEGREPRLLSRANQTIWQSSKQPDSSTSKTLELLSIPKPQQGPTRRIRARWHHPASAFRVLFCLIWRCMGDMP